MFPEEATWFAKVLSSIPSSSISPMLNVGSSTREFRAIRQPWIERDIFRPLEDQGSEIVHLDLKSAEGVDIVGDIAEPLVRERLNTHRFKSVFCSNILEHVEDRATVCDAILAVVPEGGYIFVSCPFSYPYHADPIDTMFRPDVESLSSIFPGTRVVAGEIIPCGTYARDIFESPRSFVRWTARLAFPFYKPRGWKAAVGNLRWLVRNFEATCVVLERVPVHAAVGASGSASPVRDGNLSIE